MAEQSRFAPDKVTSEERLRQIGIAIYQNEQIIKSAKPNSAQFKKASAALKQLREDFKKANDKVNALRIAAKNKTANKKIASAQEDLDRANALNDEAAAQKAREKIRQAEEDAKATGIKSYNQQREEEIKRTGARGYTGTGTQDKPLRLGEDLYTGTYKGKEYKNGILVVKKVEDTPAKTGGDKVTDDGDKKDKGIDVKSLWISYLRSTFAGLEDKTQKAQIDGILKQAEAGKWDEDTFMEALKGTVWWQTTLPSMRQFFIDTHDPRNASTFTEKIRNATAKIADGLESLGISILETDPKTGKVVDKSEYIRGIAMKATENGWDDNQIEDYLASGAANIMFTGGGTLGSYLDKVKNSAYMYGIKLDANIEKDINFSLLDPNDGRDVNYWINSMKQMAIDTPAYKPFAESLKSGRSLYEVTNSYRQQMASLLEVDSTAISWDDLMGKVINKENGNAFTFADFTKQIKNDPLWQYTRNAKETYSNMAQDLGKMFGFVG